MIFILDDNDNADDDDDGDGGDGGGDGDGDYGIEYKTQVIVMECKNLKKMDVGGLSGVVIIINPYDHYDHQHKPPTTIVNICNQIFTPCNF